MVLKKFDLTLGTVENAFNPNTPEVEASLVYTASFRAARATRRNCVSKNQTKTNKKFGFHLKKKNQWLLGKVAHIRNPSPLEDEAGETRM